MRAKVDLCHQNDRRPETHEIRAKELALSKATGRSMRLTREAVEEEMPKGRVVSQPVIAASKSVKLTIP